MRGIATVLAVCTSKQKGAQKHAVAQAELKVDWGIRGDARAGSWHRQISLLGVESIRKIQDRICFCLPYGAFAKNILTQGILLYELPIGVTLQIGRVLAQVTQIGKACHTACAIRRAVGACISAPPEWATLPRPAEITVMRRMVKMVAIRMVPTIDDTMLLLNPKVIAVRRAT
jgi:hypothetical protein